MAPVLLAKADRCFRLVIESLIFLPDQCARISLVVRSSRRGIVCYASCGDRATSGILVGLGGFEPPTSPLSGVRSNQLSYRPALTRSFSENLRCSCSSLGHVRVYAPSLLTASALPLEKISSQEPFDKELSQKTRPAVLIGCYINETLLRVSR